MKRRKGFAHLSYAQRVRIELGTENPGATLASVAKEIGVPKSTVMREIKRNRLRKETAAISRPPLPYPKHSRWPFCCNMCAKSSCSKTQLTYRAANAETMARQRRKKASGGPKPASKKRIETVDRVVSPLIRRGHSVEAAVAATECDVPASTIRSWVDAGLLAAKRIDMPRAAKFYNKKYAPSRKKGYVPARLALNRTIADYRDFVSGGRRFAVQVDTVIGACTNSYAILTIMDVATKFQICLRVRKTADGVNSAIAAVWNAFAEAGCPFDCILTDNGSEFQRLPELEATEEGEVRFRVFYCDPYQSGQKGACESNHEILRCCIRKGQSVDALTDEQVLEACSRINSYPRKSLGWKTPFDAFCAKHAGGRGLIEALGLRRYSPDEVDFKKK